MKDEKCFNVIGVFKFSNRVKEIYKKRKFLITDYYEYLKKECNAISVAMTKGLL